jgi:predicted flap endonuclease-1-like 5' DNA nuclease
MLKASSLRPRLGKTFIDRLTQDVVLSVGSSTYSRDDLVREVHVGNFWAAKRLGHALKELGITTPAQLASLAPEDLARMEGVGETTVYVLLCLQDHMHVKPMEFETTWRTQVKHARDAKEKKPKKSRKRTTPKPSRKAIRKQTELFNEQQVTQ